MRASGSTRSNTWLMSSKPSAMPLVALITATPRRVTARSSFATAPNEALGTVTKTTSQSPTACGKSAVGSTSGASA